MLSAKTAMRCNKKKDKLSHIEASKDVSDRLKAR